MQFRSVAPPVIVALLLMGVGAAIHGALTDRFGMIQTEQLQQFTHRLENVPITLGDWEGEPADVDAAQLERAQVTGHISRTYRHRTTGEAVNLFLVAGTSRHITLHTPDLCYQAAGFAMEGEPQSFPLDVGLAKPVEFASSKFYREEEGGRLSKLRIWWSFSYDGQWRRPRWARSALAGKGAIYKIYLIAPNQTTGPREGRLDEGPLADFVKTAMPKMQRALFPGEVRE